MRDSSISMTKGVAIILMVLVHARFVGDRTIDVLTWHFLSFKLISIIIISYYSLPKAQLGEFPVIEEYAYQGWWIAYVIVGVLIPLIIELLFREITLFYQRLLIKKNL